MKKTIFQNKMQFKYFMTGSGKTCHAIGQELLKEDAKEYMLKSNNEGAYYLYVRR